MLRTKDEEHSPFPFLGAAQSLLAYLYSLCRVWGLGPHVTVVGTTLRYELARVTIVLVPSLLRRVERSRVGIALGFEVIDGIDSGATSTNANHRSVLVGANDGSKRIQHSFL